MCHLQHKIFKVWKQVWSSHLVWNAEIFLAVSEILLVFLSVISVYQMELKLIDIHWVTQLATYVYCCLCFFSPGFLYCASLAFVYTTYPSMVSVHSIGASVHAIYTGYAPTRSNKEEHKVLDNTPKKNCKNTLGGIHLLYIYIHTLDWKFLFKNTWSKAKIYCYS